MFTDTPEGTTHYYADGCGEPAHNPDNHECTAGKTCKENPCKHNGKKGYWSNLPGFKCLKCGEEVNEKKK